VGEGFDLAGVGVLGGVDLPQALVVGGGLAVAAGLVVGGGGGQAGGEQGGAVGAGTVVALAPATSMGSSEANKGMPASVSSFSSWRA